MLQDIGNFARMLVRPVVTLIFVGTICALALKGNSDMGLAVVSLGGVAVNAWFSDRSNKPAGPGAK